MSKTTIADPRIKLRPTKNLLDLIADNINVAPEIPQNIAFALKMNGYDYPIDIKTIYIDSLQKPEIDMKLLKDIDEKYSEADLEDIKLNDNSSKNNLAKAESFLYLQDLIWLNQFLIKLREEKKTDLFLHNFLESSDLILPENEIIERNPELEARCQKLRDQQQNLEYYKMTKNVDSSLKYYPEDSIAFQLKAINSQLIAVLQFVVSVGAGFAFGFLGIQWMIGNLDFGFRLLLGVMCALVIALAEMYFLAKKLVEYDTAVDSKVVGNGLPKKGKSKAKTE